LGVDQHSCGAKMSDQNSTPKETQGASGSGGSEPWIIKSLNDIRAEMEKMDGRSSSSFENISTRLSGIDGRLGAIEGGLSKVFWMIAGAGLVFGLMFGGYELFTSYFDVNITPKVD
jgi:hypothetical protein